MEDRKETSICAGNVHLLLYSSLSLDSLYQPTMDETISGPLILDLRLPYGTVPEKDMIGTGRTVAPDPGGLVTRCPLGTNILLK